MAMMRPLERHPVRKKMMVVLKLQQRQLLLPKQLREKLRRRCSKEPRWRELRKRKRRLRRKESKSRWRKRSEPISKKKDSSKKI